MCPILKRIYGIFNWSCIFWKVSFPFSYFFPVYLAAMLCGTYLFMTTVYLLLKMHSAPFDYVFLYLIEYFQFLNFTLYTSNITQSLFACCFVFALASAWCHTPFFWDSSIRMTQQWSASASFPGLICFSFHDEMTCHFPLTLSCLKVFANLWVWLSYIFSSSDLSEPKSTSWILPCTIPSGTNLLTFAWGKWLTSWFSGPLKTSSHGSVRGNLYFNNYPK